MVLPILHCPIIRSSCLDDPAFDLFLDTDPPRCPEELASPRLAVLDISARLVDVEWQI